MHFLLPGRNVVSSLAIRLSINLTTCLPPCPINLATSLLIKLTASLLIKLTTSLPINLTTSLPINLTTSLFINLSLPTDLTASLPSISQPASHQPHHHLTSNMLINLSTVLACHHLTICLPIGCLISLHINSIVKVLNILPPRGPRFSVLYPIITARFLHYLLFLCFPRLDLNQTSATESLKGSFRI